MPTPIPIPLYLCKAANAELKRYIQAGIIEKCHHWTPWLCRFMFVPKKPDEEKGEVKVRLVVDFSKVNCILQSPNYPNLGSLAHPKQRDPKSRCFATLEFSSGYYQVPIPEETVHVSGFGVFPSSRNKHEDFMAKYLQ